MDSSVCKTTRSAIPTLLTAVAVLATIASTPAHASKASRPRLKAIDPSERWAFAAAVGDRKGNQTYVFKRYVFVGPAAAAATTLSYSVTKRTGRAPKNFAEAFSEASKTAEFYRSLAIGAPKWAVETDPSHRLAIFRAVWKKQNKFVEIVYRDLGEGGFSLSSSLTRRLYLLPVAIEADSIQRTLALGSGKTKSAEAGAVGKKWFDWLDLIASPAAQAQVSGNTMNFILSGLTGPNGKPIGITVTGSNLTNLNANITAVLSSIKTQLNSTLNNASNLGLQFVKNLEGTGSTFLANSEASIQSTAHNIAADASAQAKGVVDYTAQRSQALVDRAQAYVKADLDQEQNMLRKASSNANLARIAAVGTLVGAGTLAIADFALSAGGTIVDSLWHKIMGTMTEEQRKLMGDKLGQGFKDLGEAAQNLTSTESAVDQEVAALSMVAGLNPDNLARALELQIIKQDAILKNAQGAIGQNPSDDKCASAVLDAQTIDDNLHALQNVINRLPLAPSENVGDHLCSAIQDNLASWAASEQSLSNARSLLMNSSSLWMEHINTQYAAAVDPGISARVANHTCRNRDITKDLPASPACLSTQLSGKSRTGAELANAELVCKTQARLAMESLASESDKTCDDLSRVQAQRDLTVEQINSYQLAVANQQSAEGIVQKMAQANCRAGDTNGNCDGKTGAFYETRERAMALFAKAQAQGCPKLAMPPALSDSAVAIATGAPAGAVALQVDPHDPQPLGPPEQPGWVARTSSSIYHGVCGFFSGLYSSIF